MRQRGRKSSSELAIAAPVGVVARPDAPAELTPEQSDVWAQIVDAMPADWFPAESHPLLMQYVRHTVEARRIAQLIDQECARAETDVAAYIELLKAQKSETAALKTMATALRVSQQTRRTPGVAGTKSQNRTVKRPWESD